jgi:hypothetical protein
VPIVPKVLIDVCPAYVEAISTVTAVVPVTVILAAVPATEVT